MAKKCCNCGVDCSDDALICPSCGKFVTKLKSDISNEQIDKQNKKAYILITRVVCLVSVVMNLITIIMSSQSQSLKYVCMLSGIIFFVASIFIFIFSLGLKIKSEDVNDKSNYLLGIAGFIIFMSFTDFIVCINNYLFGI
jgi:Mn2+/Fe2+ NRAMP family transporter